EGGADDVAVAEPLDGSVEAEAVEVTASALADRRDEPLVVEPEHAGLARGRAVEVAARRERDRAVELGAEPPQPGALDDVEVVVRPAGEAFRGFGDADHAERARGRPGRGGDLAGQLGEPLRASSSGRDLPRLRVLADL